MADWPDTDELAQVVNVENVADWQTTLDRVMASAISVVKSVRGDWDDNVDAPDDNLAQAALRMGELLAERPAELESHLRDATFQALMTGKRRRFGIS